MESLEWCPIVISKTLGIIYIKINFKFLMGHRILIHQTKLLSINISKDMNKSETLTDNLKLMKFKDSSNKNKLYKKLIQRILRSQNLPTKKA